MKTLDDLKLNTALSLLEERLRMIQAPRMQLVVCGGSALIATGLRSRTTKDIDIVALMHDQNRLVEPEPLPESLLQAARWSMTHDVSEGYAGILKDLLQRLGYGEAAARI